MVACSAYKTLVKTEWKQRSSLRDKSPQVDKETFSERLKTL